MSSIEVIRARPPAIGVCRGCGQRIEWVTTIKGHRMPIDVPVVPLDVTEHANGATITRVESGASHFATCPAADTFRKRR